jgi:hypothetical protein
MGPYEFHDYFKFGAPLQLLFLMLGCERTEQWLER